MKEKIIRSIKEVTHNGKKYTIMVMGSICETNEINGFYVLPVTFNGKNKKIRNIEYDKHVTVPGFNEYYARTKTFNMGWAICNGDDKFSMEVGETICRRRYSKSPMKTQNGRFLTKDMCQAIVDNEVKYIEEHIADFLPKKYDEDTHVKNVCRDIIDKIYKTRINNKEKNLVNNEKIDIDTKKYLEIVNSAIKDSGVNIDNGDCVSRYIPNDGDYVSFTNEYGDKYVGIINKKEEYKTRDFYSYNFYFLAPISENSGLIDHARANVFITFTKDYPFQFQRASEDDIKLVNDYLKGARNYVWNPDTKSFKLIF